NRRVVDFARREKMLAEMEETQDRISLLEKLVTNWQDGAVKLWLTKTLLEIRREFLLPILPDVVMKPVIVTGERAEDLIAYTLSSPLSDVKLMVVALRHPHGLLGDDILRVAEDGWKDTWLEIDGITGDAFDLLLDREISLEEIIAPGKLLARFPVAVIRYS
ncbi:MAG: malto-oligosyltrehalose synthase, partial [Alphaproteobacteria bacterium]|nr:malto-oligosyltrehalose synthase [Alphaproteobacteria bacterium]